MEVQINEAIAWSGKVYLPGLRTIPESLAKALGVYSSEDKPVENEAHGPQNSVLDLLNTGTVSELTDLPTIGKVSAGKIIAARPDFGYSDRDQVESLNDSLSVDWDAVFAYEA